MGLKPEETLATYIATSVAGLTLGTNCFYGPVTPDPAEGCWVFPTGGPGPTRFLGETEAEKHYTMQIRVRADKQDFDGGLLLARAVSDALVAAIHDAAFAAYLDIIPIQSQPMYLGQDDFGLPEWSQNVEAQFKE
ncbi:MAG: hypothetical protein ACXADY_25910 [Candidatus Hodarchaeales archaeon]|jgi:hypothetical protein